ncbi:F-box protein interaction domain protein [Medicago truncatula]|uniref:F-box protein interaction domain protein n=1 Tax=Medicago truncatula TaxID=3880 RepID=G7LCP4_MEDTR|nr:F-box protein interaction domain protein [Medicago truncatula]
MHFITWNPLGLRATQLRFITWNTTEKNYTRMAKMKETLYLPSELIIQILLRLPVKSLLCFKCICKSWLSLISDPHFANSHVDVSAAKIVSISRTRPLAEIRFIDFETSINHDSVSGFILLNCLTNLYVWNPSSRFHKEIKLSPFACKFLAYNPRHLLGFGYDGLRDDYLVVLLSYDPTLVKTSSYLEFFSLRDNKWNEIEGPHITYLNATANRKAGGSFFNGAIHWLASPYHKIPLEVIVVFDLMERKLLEIPLPDDYDHGPEHYGLWVFGKFLSLWNMNFDNRTVEIWEMKEYKQQSSWTKTLVIPIDNDIPWFSPVYSTKSGDIIGTSNIGLGLVKYNNKGQLLEYFAMNSIASEVAMYTESLLSLPGGP